MANKKTKSRFDSKMPIYGCTHPEKPMWDGNPKTVEMGFFATLFMLLFLPIVLIFMFFYLLFGKEPTPEEQMQIDARRRWLAEHRMNYG